MKKTLRFLTKLKDNNNTSWMLDNINDYEEAKSEMLELAENITPLLTKFDKGLNDDVNPVQFLTRMTRDVKKSKNKDPYRCYFGLWITPLVNEGNEPAYYIHIEPGASYLCAAYWSPDIFGLQVMRSYINKNLEAFEAILNKKSFSSKFTLQSTKILKELPKGYEAGIDAEHYLKLKSYEAIMIIDDKTLISNDFASIAETSFKDAYPLITFFRKALRLI